jgi:hypothetical protein
VNSLTREGFRNRRKFTSPLGGEAHINEIVFRVVREGFRNRRKFTSPLGGEAHINQIVFRLVREGLVAS